MSFTSNTATAHGEPASSGVQAGNKGKEQMLLLEMLFDVLKIDMPPPQSAGDHDIQTIEIVDKDANLVRITCHMVSTATKPTP